MLENFEFIDNQGVRLYVRHIESTTPSNRAVILMNSRSLCVESSMGIAMGSESFGDYLARRGVHAFLVDLRGYGMSTPIQEQLVNTKQELNDPITVEKFYSDIRAAAEHIRRRLGPAAEISILGFSLLGTLVVTFGHLYPNVFKNIISLNPAWLTDPSCDPPSGYNFTIDDPTKPYTETSLERINQRLAAAQPPGQDFREPLWFEQAAQELARFHQTFNHATQRWRVLKTLNWTDHLKSLGNMENIRANLLVITSEYDQENPEWLVRRFYRQIDHEHKSLKILPSATHLCIWEQARLRLYQWTQEFVTAC